MLNHIKTYENSRKSGQTPVIRQSQMVRNIGKVLRFPHLHVQDDEGRSTVAELSLGELS